MLARWAYVSRLLVVVRSVFGRLVLFAYVARRVVCVRVGLVSIGGYSLYGSGEHGSRVYWEISVVWFLTISISKVDRV